MPINRQQRDDLAASFGRLLAGEITTDQFSAGLDRWAESEDPAVVKIADFADGLYSDTVFSHRLVGKHALSPELRQTVLRCLMFLRSDLEYLWPRGGSAVPPFIGLWSPGFYLLLASAFLFIARYESGWQSIVLWTIGLLATIPAFHWCASRPRCVRQRRAFVAAGDLDIWPFLKHEQLGDQSEGG